MNAPDRFGSKTARSSIGPHQDASPDRIVLAGVPDGTGSAPSSPPPVEGGFVKTEYKNNTAPRRLIHHVKGYLFEDQIEWARGARINLSELLRRLLDQEMQRLVNERKKGLLEAVGWDK